MVEGAVVEGVWWRVCGWGRGGGGRGGECGGRGGECGGRGGERGGECVREYAIE